MNRMALLGVGLLVVGVSIAFAPLMTFPGMMSGGCTDVGVPEGEGQGVGIIGVEGGDLLYTPDGVNECNTPLPVVLTPIGLMTLGTGLVLSSKVTEN
ncbi:hypothetical protein [Halorubrum ezzemoulense]|uniref:Uncharacterized protein n=1 Tax=Halorubrum ezzemoulense TaxID=337243 RepID=A0A256JNT6_HALEZ|nr:hypothetical protein [Halorubrum ezzemoulense]OYR70549.1 hypothetical protein DJ78_08340 [Halorubrum ezzemoulense]